MIVDQLPGGGEQIYGYAVTTVDTVQLLLTQIIDAQGNVISIGYDALGRITSITDAAGQVSQFSYGDNDPSNPDSYLVAQITDPFGRYAAFTYSGGMLASIQDQVGLVSSMTYNTNPSYPADWVSTLTTPYGLTSFNYTGTNFGTVERELEITDPMGLKQHLRFNNGQTPSDGNDPPVPAGVISHDPWSEYRNTFYWDKKAMADDPLDTNSATVYHWMHCKRRSKSVTV